MKKDRIAAWVVVALLLCGSVYWCAIRPTDRELVVIAALAAREALHSKDWAKADAAFDRVKNRWPPDSDAVVNLDRVFVSFREDLSTEQAGYDGLEVCESLLRRYE
jgi:hypothetical protein